MSNDKPTSAANNPTSEVDNPTSEACEPTGGANQSKEPSRNGTDPDRDHDVDLGAQAVGKAKFNLGARGGSLPTENIPWGYGENRVTAMARDPDWLYVYWEVTDEAIASARYRVGSGPLETWCCLRIYDTTGCVFDGANAREYQDIPVDRTSRDWFVQVNKPRTSCHVEIGVQSSCGAFEPIARSGRVDFPAKAPSNDLSVEWLTVEDASPSSQPLPAASPYVSRYEGPVPQVNTLPPMTPPDVHQRHIVPYRVLVDQFVERRETRSQNWTERRLFAWSTRVSHRFDGAYSRWSIPWITESWRTEWQGDERVFEWLVPLHALTRSTGSQTSTWESSAWESSTWQESTWQASTWQESTWQATAWETFRSHAFHNHEATGGFGPVLMRFVGDSHLLHHERGFEQFRSGPWEVVLRRLTPSESKRRVFGRWNVRRAEPTTSGAAQYGETSKCVWYEGYKREHLLEVLMIGASESRLLVESGASERWIGGASEQFWFGASEWMALGGSELMMIGASESRVAGASEFESAWEVLWLGASEWASAFTSSWATRGASEAFAYGASETFAYGASEAFAYGASEAFAYGASEVFAYGASEWMASRLVWEVLSQSSSELFAFALGGSEQAFREMRMEFEELGGASERGGGGKWGASEHVFMSHETYESIGSSELALGVFSDSCFTGFSSTDAGGSDVFSNADRFGCSEGADDSGCDIASHKERG